MALVTFEPNVGRWEKCQKRHYLGRREAKGTHRRLESVGTKKVND